MPLPNLQPYWVSTNLQSFGPVSGPFVNLVNGTRTFTQALSTDLVARGAKAATVNTRLLAWYDAQTQPAADAVADFTAHVSNYVQDVWNAGVNWYIVRPSYGGFSAITQAILPGISNPADPNAPAYSEDMYAGGVMLVLAGPPFTLYAAANILILLSTGRTADALAALQDLTTDSSSAGSVMNALSDLAALPSTEWNAEVNQLKGLFENSAIAKVLGGNVFPLDMLKAGTFGVSGIEPASVKKSTTTTFTVSGNGFLPSDTLSFNGTVYPNTFVSTQALDFTVNGSDQLLSSPGVKSVHIRNKGVDTVAGTVTVLAPGLYDDLASMSDPRAFNVWHSVTTGDILNNLIPGAATFVDKSLQTLATLGQAATEAQSLGHTALQSTGALLTTAANRAAADLATIDDSAADFLAELLSLSASVLVIPPCKGGNHELGYALSQGLNGFALNSPLVNEADGVMAMFFCAGDLDRAKVIYAINQVAALLNISSWPTLT